MPQNMILLSLSLRSYFWKRKGDDTPVSSCLLPSGTMCSSLSLLLTLTLSHDFTRRLWDSDSHNLSPHVHPVKKKKVKKPKQKGSKAESIEKVTVEQLFKQLESTAFSIDDQPYASLFKIYHQEFLLESVSKGLINPSSLSIAGDGTPVVTSARERRHRVCDCASKGITDCCCDQYFSQPDCDIGWDSSRDCFYHGYDLYMIVASDSESDLPIFPLLNPASKHDSHGFLEAYFRMKAFLPDFKDRKWLLDSAHDAMPYYLFCRHEHFVPFIDLNEKRGVKVHTRIICQNQELHQVKRT